MDNTATSAATAKASRKLFSEGLTARGGRSDTTASDATLIRRSGRLSDLLLFMPNAISDATRSGKNQRVRARPARFNGPFSIVAGPMLQAPRRGPGYHDDRANWGSRPRGLIAELKAKYKEPWMAERHLTYGDMADEAALEKAGKADRRAVARPVDAGWRTVETLSASGVRRKGRASAPALSSAVATGGLYRGIACLALGARSGRRNLNHSFRHLRVSPRQGSRDVPLFAGASIGLVSSRCGRNNRPWKCSCGERLGAVLRHGAEMGWNTSMRGGIKSLGAPSSSWTSSIGRHHGKPRMPTAHGRPERRLSQFIHAGHHRGHGRPILVPPSPPT